METEKGFVIPVLEEEEKRFIGKFSKLSQEEIGRILAIIIDKIKKDTENDLVIKETDVHLEEWYFLCLIHQYGGIKKIKKDNVGFITTYFNESIETFFKNFKLGGRMKGETEETMNQLKYQDHLEAVKKAILKTIYEDKL